jgi:hypothetical protein
MELSGHWLHYTPDNSPLPGALAWPIAFDSRNRAWMCVSGKSGERLGLVVFDGHDWTHYPPGFGGLPDQPIYGMVVDLHDHVWLHVPFFGIYQFDGEQVETHRPRFGGPPPMVGGANVTAVDVQGNVWLAWPSVGVFRFDGSTWKTYTSSNCGLTSDWVMALSADSRGTVWFAAQTSERAECRLYWRLDLEVREWQRRELGRPKPVNLLEDWAESVATYVYHEYAPSVPPEYYGPKYMSQTRWNYVAQHMNPQYPKAYPWKWSFKIERPPSPAGPSSGGSRLPPER